MPTPHTLRLRLHTYAKHMTRVTPIVAFLGLALQASGEWYEVGRERATITVRVTEPDKSFDVPVRKLDLRVTAIILRRDTEDATHYWIEATLKEQRDSGDGYLLAFDDVVLRTIYTRGNKWAIGFSSLHDARRCFQHLRKLHRLDSDHARDATKDS